MLAVCLLLSLFFLIWIFVLATITHAFLRLGENYTLESIEKSPRRFLYYPFHCFFFKDHSFEILVFSSTLSENLARLGYVTAVIFSFIFFEPITILAIVVTLLILLFLALLFGDFLPRLWAIRAPETALMFSLTPASFFLFLSFPISFIFLKLSALATQVFEKETGGDPLEEMKETVVQILRSANVKEILNSSDKKWTESVMVPRVDIFCLPAETSIRSAARELVDEGYSRTPVYRETVDNIVGVLMFRDILELYMDCEVKKKDIALLDSSIETISKSVFYTPETKKVSHLLQEFLAKQMHMAIVVDEYGGTEGVVTMEDILEEIVGEIGDEYDIDEEALYTTQPGGGGWIVDARMSIHDTEDIFGIHIPQEGDYDTIGGYILHKVGEIPQKGVRLQHEEFDIEILGSSERSVEKIRITPKRKEKML